MTPTTYLPGKTIAECAAAYTELGWGIVEIPRGSKAPKHPGWNNPGGYVTSPDMALKVWGKGQNMGVVLGPSKIATLDLDDLENSRVALKAVGINLDVLLDDESAVKLIGNPDNHAKLVFRVLDGLELSTKKLNWPSHKKPGEMAGIFELRAGPVQDVLPPSIHPETQQPYRWGRPFWDNGGVPPLAAVLEYLWANWEKYLSKMEAACPWAPKESRQKNTKVALGAHESFDGFALENGLVPPPGGWIADGEIHRCDAHGPDGVIGRNDGSYLIHADEPLNGWGQNHHRHSQPQPWKPAKAKQITQAGMGTTVPIPAAASEPGPSPRVVVLGNMRVRTVRELLLDETLTEPESILEGLAAIGELTVLGGPAKAMKSWTVKRIGLCLASGTPWLGFRVPRPFKTVYLSAEGREARLRARFQKLTAFTESDSEALDRMGYVATLGSLKIDTDAGQSTFYRLIEPYEVIVIDPLYRFLSEGDENSHKDQRVQQDLFDRVKDWGKSIIVVHHVRKPGQKDAGISELRGAGLAEYADGVIMLSRNNKDKDDRFTAKFTPRNEEPIPDMDLLRNGVILQQTTPEEGYGRVVAMVTNEDVTRVLGAETMKTDALYEAIANKYRVSVRTSRRAVDKAFDDGEINKTQLPGKGRPWGYRNKAQLELVADE